MMHTQCAAGWLAEEEENSVGYSTAAYIPLLGFVVVGALVVVEVLVVLVVVDVFTCLLVLVVGLGSPRASMQYDWLGWKLPHEGVMEGFYNRKLALLCVYGVLQQHHIAPPLTQRRKSSMVPDTKSATMSWHEDEPWLSYQKLQNLVVLGSVLKPGILPSATTLVANRAAATTAPVERCWIVILRP